MGHVSVKSVILKKIKNMVIWGLGFTAALGFFPITALAGFQGSIKQTCGFNNQPVGGSFERIFTGERIIMARGGNRSGGGGAMGQGRCGNSKRGCIYGSGYGAKRDGAGTGQKKNGSKSGYRDNSRDGTGDGTKKEAGTGDRNGTGPKENRMINRGN